MTLLLVMNLGFAWGAVTPATPPYTFGHRAGSVDASTKPQIDQGSTHGRSGPITHATPKRSM